MRNFVSFEWEIGNREHHLTRFFFLFKDATRFTWSHAYFFDHKSPLFLQQEFLNNSDDFFYVNVINCQVFLKKLFFEFKYCLRMKKKTRYFFLCWCRTESVNCKIWIYASQCFHHDMTILFFTVTLKPIMVGKNQIWNSWWLTPL